MLYTDFISSLWYFLLKMSTSQAIPPLYNLGIELHRDFMESMMKTDLQSYRGAISGLRKYPQCAPFVNHIFGQGHPLNPLSQALQIQTLWTAYSIAHSVMDGRGTSPEVSPQGTAESWPRYHPIRKEIYCMQLSGKWEFGKAMITTKHLKTMWWYFLSFKSLCLRVDSLFFFHN